MCRPTPEKMLAKPAIFTRLVFASFSIVALRANSTVPTISSIIPLYAGSFFIILVFRVCEHFA